MKRKKIERDFKLSITARHLPVSDRLEDYLALKIGRLQKYFDEAMEVRVIVSLEKNLHIAEVIISARNLQISGNSQTYDIYSSIDDVVEKLEKQLKKHREKARERKRVASKIKSTLKEKAYPVKEEFEKEIEEDEKSAIVRIETINYKPMSPEEAVMQLEILKRSFFAFVNSKTEEINIVYRLSEGGYALITR